MREGKHRHRRRGDRVADHDHRLRADQPDDRAREQADENIVAVVGICMTPATVIDAPNPYPADVGVCVNCEAKLRRAYAWSAGEEDTWSYPSASDQIVEISSANSSGVQLGFSW